MHGSRSRRAASNAALRRIALVRETRLAAGAAARGGRERSSEAARWLDDVRTAVGYESEAGEVRELEGEHDVDLKCSAAAECSLGKAV